MPLLEVLYIKQVQYKFTLHTFYTQSNSADVHLLHSVLRYFFQKC